MSEQTNNNILEVDKLSVRFGGIVALKDVSFAVKRDSITALIGPNGAGKTTVFNCLTGFYKATSGQINLNSSKGAVNINKILGQSLKLSSILRPTSLLSDIYYKMFGGTHLVCRAGLARTFQNIRLFPDLTVIENLLIAQHQSLNKYLFSGVVHNSSYKILEKAAIKKSFEWLSEINMTDYANKLAAQLSYGNQRRLEIVRAMCTNPEIICLDEPAAGLNPQETEELSLFIKDLRSKHSLSIFVIEHDMNLVMGISDHIIVLNYGQVIADAIPQVIKNDPKVLAAYLGDEQ